MSDHLGEYTVHGDGNSDIWLRHTPCRSLLPMLDDPWTLDVLVSLAEDHEDQCPELTPERDPGAAAEMARHRDGGC